MSERLLDRLNHYPFFYSDAGAGTDGGSSPAGEGDGSAEGGAKEGGKTFTQEELNAILDKKFSKWQKDTEAKVAAARTEAGKLASLSAEEKAKYEREQADQKLAQREAQITRRELRAQALETLGEKGLPRELSDVLDYSGADRCKDSITSVERAFRFALEKAVNEKLKGSPPPAGGGSGGVSVLRTVMGLPPEK